MRDCGEIEQSKQKHLQMLKERSLMVFLSEFLTSYRKKLWLMIITLDEKEGKRRMKIQRQEIKDSVSSW